MKLLEVFGLDYSTVPKTVGYKIMNKIATLGDQEDALKKPEWAYYFARHVIRADIKKCEEIACQDPHWAYCFAFNIPGADIKKCEEAACQAPAWAYLFALKIPGADKERCMKAAGR